jgi:hypothetical protein
MSLDATNQALINAVHALANKKLQAAVNAAKRAATASNSNKNKEIANLKEALAAAKAPVTAAATVSPTTPAAPQVVTGLNELVEKIQKGEANRMSNNNFKSRPNYTALTNKTNVNTALAKRRANIRNELIGEIGKNPSFNTAANNRFNFLSNANKQAVRNAVPP